MCSWCSCAVGVEVNVEDVVKVEVNVEVVVKVEVDSWNVDIEKSVDGEDDVGSESDTKTCCW